MLGNRNDPGNGIWKYASILVYFQIPKIMYGGFVENTWIPESGEIPWKYIGEHNVILGTFQLFWTFDVILDFLL